MNMNGNANYTEHILSNRIIGSASEENINKYILSSTSVAHFSVGELLCSPKKPPSFVGIVLSGRAAAESQTGNGNALLRSFSEGDMFGIADLYSSDSSFPTVITALTELSVLLIDRDGFRRLLAADADALREYLRFMSERVMLLNKKIAVLTAGSAEKKLAFFLSENQLDGEYLLPSSMSSLAELLNVGRASLYRALERLEGDGLIRRSGKNILIPDKNALCSFIEKSFL